MITEKDLKIGDILFEDSDRSGPRIVKFFMTAPSVYHHIWRAITKPQEKCEYYHPVMYIGENRVIEQQWEVEYGSLNFNQKLLIVRKKNLDRMETGNLQYLSERELGQKWGVINTLGKFLTWLTGLKVFGRIIRWPTTEVSALRVCRWYNNILGEKFGQYHYEDNTTKTMVDYIKSHPNEWEIVYESRS